METTHENQGSVQVLVVLPNIFCVVLGCFFLVNRIEPETRVAVSDGVGGRSESILNATFVQPTSNPGDMGPQTHLF